MEVLLVALAARVTQWTVGGRWSHPLVSFSASCWVVTTGRSASVVCSRVDTLVKTPVIPMWSCGAGLGNMGRLVSVHKRNQTFTHFSARRESGVAVTHGDLTATAWRKAKTLPQSSEMVTNVLVVACFGFPVFVVFFLCLNAAFAFVVIVVLFVSAGVFPLLRPLRDGASKNPQEISRVRPPVEDYGLRE